MRVLVTGAAGMLGSDLVPLLTERGDAVTAVDLEVDVTNAVDVMGCVGECRPEAIFHLAAWTDVDGAEEVEEMAAEVNESGTGHVAVAALMHEAALIYPSTDYVFDGRKGSAYAEDEPTSPVGAYGRTKLAGERAALETHPAGTRVARTAWLYGRHGKNFVDTMRRLGRERDRVSVVADQTGSPTWTRDLAPALVALLDQPPGIYHTAGGGAVTWADFAEAIFAESGIACAVERVTTAEFGRPAPRPAYSPLISTRPGAPRLRDWREALRDYLEEVPDP